MEATEYIAPNGAAQMVDSAVVEARLRAAGWRTRGELEDLAPFRPDAAEQLRLATEASAARERRVKARMAAAEPVQTTGRDEAAQPEQSASRKQRSKTSS